MNKTELISALSEEGLLIDFDIDGNIIGAHRETNHELLSLRHSIKRQYDIIAEQGKELVELRKIMQSIYCESHTIRSLTEEALEGSRP